jgi:hypothetical protein
MKRRTEITVEEHIRIVRRAGVSAQIACADCSGEVLMVTPEDAALAVGVTARVIYRWLEEKKIHFRESAAGTLVVCPRSVLEQARTA